MKKLGLIVLMAVSYSAALAQLSADFEGGYIFNIPYNTVRIPSKGGTQFDLAHDLSPGSTLNWRGRLNYTIADRHMVSVLAAPLTIKSGGTLDFPIVYSGQIFEAGTDIQATYTFNSYRLTYRYLFVNKEKIKIGAGLTAKVRQARIMLSNELVSADYPDLGIVPLVNFFLKWTPTDRWIVLLEGDALVSGSGRAEDVFVGPAYRLGKLFSLKAGYRILEGGADVEKNYNFSFFHYGVVGILINY